MSEIYKINKVVNNEISKIYIFAGNKNITATDYSDIFTASRLKSIKEKNIPIAVINSYIHGDDTILRIKEKILMDCTDINQSTAEMYLFSVTEKLINSNNSFNNLTQEDTIELTDVRLKAFLHNIVSTKNTIKNKRVSSFFDKAIVRKDKYEYDEFDNLNIEWDSDILLTQPIGQKLVVNKNYPFISNPYNNNTIDGWLQRQLDNIITTQNSYLLMKYFPIENGNIYVCFAEDVLDYANDTELNEEYFLKLYYPTLFKKIKTKEELQKDKLKMYNEEKSKIEKYFKKINDRVDLFYNIWNNNPLDYEKIGISHIHITVRSLNQLKLPLDVLFKIIHSSKNVPLIKYNPGANYENIYRLFTDTNISLSGIKVPTLYVLNNNRKTKILNISKTLSRKQSVGFYIEHTFKRVNFELYCEFYQDGSIEIFFDSEILLDIRDINKIIKDAINNSIIDIVGAYLKQSGYEYMGFSNITDKNVEINNLKYKFIIKNKKKININKIVGCVGVVFNIYKGTVTKDTDVIKLMYKRVNAFKVMDSIKSFITRKRQENDSFEEIVTKLLENFPKDIADGRKALEIISDWSQEVEMVVDSYGSKKIVESNPGFETLIESKIFDTDKITEITIENINNLYYIPFITIYIDSLLKIALKTKLTSEMKTGIDNLCKKKVKNMEKIDEIEDIKAVQEQRGPVRFGTKKELTLEDLSEDENELSEEDSEEESDEEGEEEDEDKEEEEALEIIPSKSPPKSPSKSPSKVDDGDSSPELEVLSEDDEESDFDEDMALGGGGKGDDSGDEDEIEIDLEGTAISGAKSIFTKKLKESDPDLFLKKDTPGYHSYSRACPGQYRRQPIVLTDEELKYIDDTDRENNTKSYDESVRYGSKEDKKFNYICPRFWCIRDDKGNSRSLSLKQINDGECGGWDALVPEGAKKVPKGKRIVEFTDERFHRDKSNIPKNHPARKVVYKPMYPGFQDAKKHPQGLCIPCCFQTPFTNEGEGEPMKDMFKKSLDGKLPEVPMKDDGTIDMDELDKIDIKFKRIKDQPKKLSCVNEQKEKSRKTNTRIDDTPIMSFPLEENQLGYMNLSLQKFLGFKNRDICYTKKSGSGEDKRLKQQRACIVRLGIAKNRKENKKIISTKNQSFLQLLANVYEFYNKTINIIPPGKDDAKIISITRLKEIFIENLTIDKFISVQNGILPKLFKNENIEIENLNNYKGSKYFRKIKNVSQKRKIAQAFENFKNYINDDDEKITYQYIWDLVCKPLNNGGVLFERGINLLIFRNPNDDITSKIEMICPTNHYSDEFFDEKKLTLMVYNKGDYFEPLCKIQKNREDKNKFEISKFFSKKMFKLKDWEKTDIKTVLTKIKKLLTKNCIAKKSLKEADYAYKMNISSYNIIIILPEIGYRFVTQIINSDNKVIGLIVNKGDGDVYIPSLPSNVDINEDFTPIAELDVYADYEFTKNKLQEIYETSNRKIPCNPKSKLISDNMIVGIKTITNQVVPVIPIPKTDGLDDLDEEVSYASYESANNLLNDEEMLTSDSTDEERSKMIKKIELENNFYKLFRDTLKIIINQSSKREEKTGILNLVSSPTIPYIEKLAKLIPSLQTLLEPAVNFDTDFELVSLDDYTDMITCLGLNKSNCDKNSHCTFMRENTCELSLPKKNLYSNSDNRNIYFKKLADEIIRYSKIRKYIFTSSEFLSFERVNYKINDNEIILLEELLLESYLEDIRLREDNKYITTTNIYDIVNPKNKITYNTTFNKSKSEVSNCIDKSTPQLDSKYLTDYLIKDSSDKIEFVNYKSSISCMFEPIITIIKDYTGKKSISIDNIKNKLIDAYLKLEMPQTTLIGNIKKEKYNISNWSVFALINYYYGRKDLAQSIIETPASNKEDKIELEIKQSKYKLNEFDIFLIFKEYKIPVILKMKNKGSLLNTSLKIFDTSTEADNEVYMILYYTKGRIRSGDYLGLAQKDKKYKIPKEILQDNLLDGEKDIANYLTTSLKKKEKEKEIKKIQDKEAHERRKEKKQKHKKLKDKMKLPSE